MKRILFVLPMAISFIFMACSSSRQLPNYLQSGSDTTGKQPAVFPDLTIQKNDMLSIQVYSASTRPQSSDAFYNLPAAPATAAPAGGALQSAPAIGNNAGFLVDINGNIEYPRIGVLHVEGLSKQQLGDLIKKKINEKDSVLTDPSVIVRFQNLKITVLGEVKRPGVISFPGERMTILEAIGLAGDVDVYGMKDKVTVIREINGERETGTIDLSSKQLFESPYYNLAQNDVVLVEPSKEKGKRLDRENTLREAGFIISVITAVAVVVNLFR